LIPPSWKSIGCVATGSSNHAKRFALAGFRNRDRRGRRYLRQATIEEKRRRAARPTRRLALWRAHGLIRKVGGPQRWPMTEPGRRLITALRAARQADGDRLTPLPA